MAALGVPWRQADPAARELLGEIDRDERDRSVLTKARAARARIDAAHPPAP